MAKFECTSGEVFSIGSEVDFDFRRLCVNTLDEAAQSSTGGGGGVGLNVPRRALSAKTLATPECTDDKAG